MATTSHSGHVYQSKPVQVHVVPSPHSNGFWLAFERPRKINQRELLAAGYAPDGPWWILGVDDPSKADLEAAMSKTWHFLYLYGYDADFVHRRTLEEDHG